MLYPLDGILWRVDIRVIAFEVNDLGGVCRARDLSHDQCGIVNCPIFETIDKIEEGYAD